ncbi:MAG: ribose-phosphate pyrophosphokinase [Candidatus Pacearchaeota archaeon]
MPNGIVLLADSESNVWKQAQEILKYLQKKINVRLVEVQVKKFRNGEKKIKIKENIRKQECFFLHDSSKKPDEWFLELLATLQALKSSGAREITAVLPCLLYSRQDRKDESRVAITAKLVADCINMYADRVITIDLHAAQIQGFYNIPLDNLYSFPVVINYLKERCSDLLKNLVIVATDAGAVKLANSFSNRLYKLGIKSEIAIGSKTRPKEGEVSEIKIIGEVKGKNALIIDDIIDSGNTIIKCADVLKKLGANKIFVYATHGIFSDGFEKFKDIKIFTSDTFPQDKGHVEVISLTPLLAEAIYREAKGESLSELFD